MALNRVMRRLNGFILRLVMLAAIGCGSVNGGPQVEDEQCSEESCVSAVRASRVNGKCGSADGAPTTTAPTSELCSAGAPTTVSGTGPWTWSCVGGRRGSTAQCSAPLQQDPAPPPADGGNSTSTCAPWPSHPDASCTGTSGTLTPYTGPTEITTDGQIFENLIFNATMIYIAAKNVTFRNCKFVYTGALDETWALVYAANAGAVFDHCELDGRDKVARAISGEGGITVKNCNIHDTGNGVEISSDFSVTDSYIWNIYTPAGMDWHEDGIQAWGETQNVTILHNTVLLLSNGDSAAQMHGVGTQTQTNVLVQHNLFAGGGYTISVGGEGGNTNVRVIENHMSTMYYPKVGYFGLWYDQQPDMVHYGNTIYETGASADGDI